MKTQKPKIVKLILKYSVILAAINIIYAITLMMFALHYKNNIVKFILPLIALVAIITRSISDYKKMNQNFLKLIDALKVGMLIAVISAILITGYKIAFDTFIEPDFYLKHLEANRSAMFETHVNRNPGMTPEQFDMDMEEARIRFWKPQYTLILLAQTLLGLGIAFCTGWLLRKSK